MALFFALWSGLRLLSLGQGWQQETFKPFLADHDLPFYTILLPLYREDAVIAQLAKHLAALDYPKAKLEIIAILESDDEATRHALAACPAASRFGILIAPDHGPRTKPKALMAAMPFIRGDCVVIYDAEDRPDPKQLREAAEAFRSGGHRLGCVQAPLCIEMPAWNWLSMLYAAEYAGLFRIILPALSRWGWPLPLGGTSNHFRSAALRSTGGWDPFNVTEDADLGLRLARHGWKVGTIARPTFETCPDTLRAWAHQRARWHKGWMQTSIVHLMKPRALIREAGRRGAATIAFTILASTACALLFIPSLIVLMMQAVIHGPETLSLTPLWIGLFGFISAMLNCCAGLWREKRFFLAPALLLTPVYWFCLSYAAWIALSDLISRPFHWRKTAHQPV